MDIQSYFNLQALNTFGLSTRAKYFTELTDLADINIADLHAYPEVFILGGGSNILLSKDYQGLVLKVGIKGWEVIQENEEEVLVKIGAGENWHEVVFKAVENNWGGIENLALIPGTVGAAPIQNIGAYGMELKDVLHSVEGVYLNNGQYFVFNAHDCKFGYRDSIFKNELKGKVLIAHVVLRLSKKPKLNISYGAIATVLQEKNIRNPQIKDVAEAVIQIRQSKLPDPDELGNAGSFFKNPVIGNALFRELKMSFPTIPGYPQENNQTKVPAGWLIEQAGWKGKKIGNTGAHAQQALVLVNYGAATGKEILNLAQQIQDSVYVKYGIKLEREVTVI